MRNNSHLCSMVNITVLMTFILSACGPAATELPVATEPPLPTATDTPASTDTPTPTPVPDPIPCNRPAVTNDMFPQLAEEVSKQFPFYGPENDPTFDCEAVFDIFHNESTAVRIEYQNFENNFGFWGIGVNGSSFDISKYHEICFWAYAQKPKLSFRLKMKDTGSPPTEDGPIIILGEANTWEQVCTDLTEFSSLGIELDKLENINLGFEKPTGSAEIWLDDFELVK